MLQDQTLVKFFTEIVWSRVLAFESGSSLRLLGMVQLHASYWNSVSFSSPLGAILLLLVFALICVGITVQFEDASRFMHRLRKNTVAFAGWVLILLGLVESVLRHLK